MASLPPPAPDRPERLNPEISGYRGTANLMGNYPELAIFRTFRSAGALDLSYRQAELHLTIGQWAGLAAKDAENENLPDYDASFAELLATMNDPDEQKSAQWRTWLDLREMLRTYYDALLRFQKVCNLPRVDEQHLSLLHRHLDGNKQGACYLKGFEAEIYRNPNKPDVDDYIKADLTSIAKFREEDQLNKFARGPVINFLHERFGLDFKKDIKALRAAEGDIVEYPYKVYSPEHSNIVARVLYSLLTSVLVTIAILSLNYFRSLYVRIALILVNNLLFTVAMALSVKGKPSDFFGVAAAYAAVLVVFAASPLSTDPPAKT